MWAADKADFEELVARAMSEPGRAHMRPVVEKELLHYDILYALHEEGLLAHLIFQGGTSLRLMYRGSRFSEDLDFACPHGLEAVDGEAIQRCVEDYVASRYELNTRVKPPREHDQEGVQVKTWQLSVETAPARPDLPRQRIKIEIADVPAYTAEPMPLGINYDWLPEGYSSVLVPTETLKEILADKLVSFPVTEHVRFRDIWDIAWLRQPPRETVLDPELVKTKLEDYGVTDYTEKLARRREQLPELVHSKEFAATMNRFLPSEVQERTIARDGFLDYLAMSMDECLHQMENALSSDEPGPSGPEFKM